MSPKSRKSSEVTNADLYLEIAADAVEKLRKCPRPVVIGSRSSEHFRHALVVSVFSAFAVEYALTELIWVSCFFRTPEPHRQISLLCASKLHKIPEKLEFVRKTTKIPSKLVDKMQKLFEYRNGIAHCRVKAFDGKVLDFDSVESLVCQGRAAELDMAIESALEGKEGALKALAKEAGKQTRYLEFAPLGSEDLDAAHENFKTATEALAALRSGWGSPPRG